MFLFKKYFLYGNYHYSVRCGCKYNNFKPKHLNIPYTFQCISIYKALYILCLKWKKKTKSH